MYTFTVYKYMCLLCTPSLSISTWYVMYTINVYKYMGMLCTYSLSISTCVCYVQLNCL